MNYILCEKLYGDHCSASAIGKARKDVVEIALKNGYQPFSLEYHFHPDPGDGLLKKAKQYLTVYRKWMDLAERLSGQNKILFQYPFLYNTPLFDAIFRNISAKGIKTIAIIHDLDSLRKKRHGLKGKIKNLFTVFQDEHTLKKCDYIIAHNDRMKQYFIQMGYDPGKIVALEIFDYLSDDIEQKSGRRSGICIAGNLSPEKAEFIYKLQKLPFDFYLYGSGFQKRMLLQGINTGKVIYKGVVDAERLPCVIHAKFGLVWDGSSLESCVGAMGNYERYNNPHKLSLYLAAGIPVIVWSQAATAVFVRQYQVGIAIDSLCELKAALDRVDEATYATWRRNAEKIGKKIRKGYFTSEALRKIGKM